VAKPVTVLGVTGKSVIANPVRTENPVSGGVPPLFCTWISYTNQGDTWTTPAVFNSGLQSVTLENTAGFASANYQSTQNWQTVDGLVSFENVVEQIDNVSSFDQSFFAADIAQGELIAGAYATNLNGGELRNAYNGVPIGPIAMGVGYKNGFKLDAENSQVVIYDNQANEATEAFNPLYNPANVLNFGFNFSTLGSNKFVNKLNTGSAAFELPQSQGTYCSPFVDIFCAPVNFSISQPPPPNDQTMILTGADNLTLETASLGNTGVQAAVFAAETFQTLTEEVKIEGTMIKDTTTGASYFGNVFFQSPNVISGVQYLPNSNGGELIDAQNGAPLGNSIAATAPYTLASYLDASGVGRFAAGEGAVDNSGALSVNGAYNNANPVNMLGFAVAGENVGDELDVTFNFGSSAFVLGEDAERWCKV